MRATELAERQRALDADAAALSEQLATREQAIVDARERAAVAERGQEEARELRGRWQIRQARDACARADGRRSRAATRRRKSPPRRSGSRSFAPS